MSQAVDIDATRLEPLDDGNCRLHVQRQDGESVDVTLRSAQIKAFGKMFERLSEQAGEEL